MFRLQLRGVETRGCAITGLVDWVLNMWDSTQVAPDTPACFFLLLLLCVFDTPERRLRGLKEKLYPSTHNNLDYIFPLGPQNNKNVQTSQSDKEEH